MSDEESFQYVRNFVAFRAILKFCSSSRLLYKDTESTFSELLHKDCAVAIYTKNLQILMVEMYKTKNEPNPLLM